MNNINGNINKKRLLKVIITRAPIAFVMMALLLFLPARTIHYWEAWVFLAILFIPASFVLIYLYRKDPELLVKRMKMKEKEKEQKFLQLFSALFFIIMFLTPGFDKYYGWSSVPLWLKIFSAAMVLLGYIMFFVVLRQNSYASRVIEIQDKQKVIDTGLYAVIRHPMYDAVLLLYGFAPLALGTYWALIGDIIILFILIFRVVNEEKVLMKELDGYTEYMKKVRYRLIPGLW